MTQDPALFEDSPAIKAAVAEERRIGGIEADVKTILTMVRSIDGRVEIQNGRVNSSEKAIEEIRDAQNAIEQRLRDRRLWERLDLIESWRRKRDEDAAHADGVSEGKVALRTSDKVAFGAFVSLVGVLVTVASKVF